MESSLSEKRRPKRVRFSEINDVHVFEANHTDTNSGIRAAQPGVSADEVVFGATDTASEDDVDLNQERQIVLQKVAKIAAWSSCDDTSRINFEHSDDDQGAGPHSANRASAECPSVHAWDRPSRGHYRPSAAFAYQRGPSLPRCSMLTEDNMSADESGPLAGMPQAYINSARAADMRSPGVNAYAPQHNGAIDRMPSGGDSPTDMDTGISSPPRYQEGRQGAIAPANSAEDQHEAASRPITPEIREDSWSCGTAQDDTHDRLRDITGVMNVASGFNSNQDGAVDPVLLSTGRRPASREPLHRDRTALAPLSNMKRASFPAIEGRKQNENQTENLLNGDFQMDSAFLNADNVAQSDGTTARLLNLDVQDESIGDQLLNLDAEKVDDADYLLKSMVMPEAQMSASRNLTGCGEIAAEIPSRPENQELTEDASRQRPEGPSNGARAGLMLNPSRNAQNGHGSCRQKSPGARQATKRHRGPPSSPLRQMSSRLRTTTPKSPCPTTGTPLKPIIENRMEDSKSPAPPPQAFGGANMSPDGQNPLRILPFMHTPRDLQALGIDEDEMCQQNFGGDLLSSTPTGQTPAPGASAFDMPHGRVPVSPSRVLLSPLAAVSTHGFMQLIGIQHEVDACKLSDPTVGAVLRMQTLAKLGDPGSTANLVGKPHGGYGPLLCRALDQAYTEATKHLLQHSGTAQQQMLDMLKKIEQEIGQNPPSVYHSFKYASCEEQATILRTMSNHLTSAIEDANAMISSMVLTCEAGGREKAMASNLQAKQLASETREPRQALCAKTSQVDHTCEAISDMQLHLTELVQAQHDRYTVAQTEVERSRSQLQEITAKLQHSQDDIEEMETDVESKKAALERFRCESEKQMQDLQAAAAQAKYEELREMFILMCDETGCLMKKARKYEWNGQLCTEVTWEVTERVMCILRFTDTSTDPAVFLRYHGGQTAEDVQFKSLLESCLELDPTDGRCAMVEEHGSDSPSRILKWCKDVAIQVEALSLEVSRLPMNVHMATSSNVPVGGRIMISFWCVQRDIQVALNFAAAVATTCGDKGILTLTLQDFHHNATTCVIADVVNCRLQKFLQPGDAKWYITNACLELRTALLAESLST